MNTIDLLDGRLKIKHLVQVLEIARSGSIIGAAQALHVTQPVITRALREVEEILGTELFVRGPRGVTPTVHAEFFLQQARTITGHLRHVSTYFGELEQGNVGSIIIGTHLAGANVLVPQAIRTFKEQSPNVEIHVRDGHPIALLQDLQEGKLHLLVSRSQPLDPQQDLEQTRIHQEAFSLVAATNHPATITTELTLEALLQYPWVLPASGTFLRQELERIFHTHNLPLPNAPIECSTPLTVMSLVRDGGYIALLPETLVKEQPGIRLLDITLEGMGQKIVATYPTGTQNRPLLAKFLQHLQQAGQNLGRP